MKERWQRLAQAFNQRERRERAILLGCVIVLALFLFYRVGIEPAERRIAQARQNAANHQAQITQLEATRSQLEAQAAIDPNAAARQQLQALERDIAARHVKLGQQGARGAEALVQALDEALAGAEGLTLGRIEALPAEPLAAASGPSDKPTGPVLYRHRLRVAVSGAYPALQRYVEQLEQRAPEVAWQRLELKVERWPVSVLTLEWAIISREARWLGA
ncbi:type II secretion system protein GspM [Chitinimonas lacunae]|uniref:Type II secretion system protein GspM n=1 Tax=Chitinimonas lacunae TaxID=1963018 RepID=A0ABV8MVR7_9NEIS